MTCTRRTASQPASGALRPLALALLVASLGASLGASPAASQSQAEPPLALSDEPEVARAAYYTFVRPGEIAVTAIVLGDVRTPGYYAVGLGTSAERLVALAGGAVSGSTDARDRTTTTVRLYRPTEGGERQLVLERELEELMRSGAPAVDDGDLVEVEVETRRRTLPLDSVLRIVTTAATLFLVIDSVVSR